MTNNKLADCSMDFAIKILEFTNGFSGHNALKTQLEKSGTSIGANIREANYAHGKADFIAKMQIALKECYETEYWLELFEKAGLASKEALSSLIHECGSLRRLLIASINTAKKAL